MIRLLANNETGTAAGPDGEYRPRSSFRGERGGRGRGRGRGDMRGKRDFDRQSGSDKSGVKPVEKREGSGPHNWGSVQDEIEGQMEPATEEAVEGEPEAAPAAAAAAAPEATETK